MVFFGSVGLNTFEMCMQNGGSKGLMNRKEAVGKEERISLCGELLRK